MSLLYWQFRRKWICPECGNREETSGHCAIKYCNKCYTRMGEEEMVQQDEKGCYHPTKVFPCDCGSEGVMVAIKPDDRFEEPYVNMAFWSFGNSLSPFLSGWERIKYAWHILKGGSPWSSMVGMTPQVAKNLANHILYLVSKINEKKKDKSHTLVNWPRNSILREDKSDG